MSPSDPTPASTSPEVVRTRNGVSRRRWLYGTVGVGATIAGLGLAWWQNRSNVGSAGTTASLWDLSFDSPGRAPLSMRSFRGRPLLLNFWATWCPPCVEEFPLLDGFYTANVANGWQVLGLAADKASAVEAFLQQIKVQFPVALAGMPGIDLSKSLGNQGGGLPFTVVLGSAGKMLDRKMGRVSPEDLARWASLR